MTMQALQNILVAFSVVSSIAFAVYAASGRQTRLARWPLFLALATSALALAFDALAVNYPLHVGPFKRLSLIAEAALPATWLLFSSTFKRNAGDGFSITSKVLLALSPVPLAAAVFLPLDMFFYSPDFGNERMLFLGSAGFFFYVCVLVYAVVSAMNLEATLRTASGTAKWTIKFEILGSGALLAMLIFYYSHAILYRAINMDLLTLRSAVTVTAVALMAYSRAFRGNSVKVHVSRDMAYRSLVVFIVGIYLLGLGLIGEGMRYFGPVKTDIAAVMAFAGLIALIIVLLSEQAKRKIKVFIHKNFYANKYDYRSQWLKFTDRLASSRTGEEVLRSILSGFCETFGIEGNALYLIDQDDGCYRMVATSGMDALPGRFQGDAGFVRQMRSGRVYNVRDEDPDGVTGEEKALFRSEGVSFVIPLLSGDAIEGFIVMGRPMNAAELYTYEDYDLMKTLARQASSTVLNLRLSHELSRAREMEAIGRVSAFVAHDLKNHVSTISLLADNAYDNIDDPEFQKDMVDSLRNTAAKMKTLISRLKDMKEKGSLELESTDLYAISAETIRAVNRDVALEGCGATVEADREEVQKVILNLVLNAIEASGAGARVRVEVGSSGQSAFVRVSDSGCGMTEEFMRTRLFKPFSTTKKKGLGIGLYQCKQVIEAHGGSIEAESAPGKGSVFTVNLPLAKKPGFVMNLEGTDSYGKASGNRR